VRASSLATHAWPGLALVRPAGMLCGVQEIARFLAANPPFDGLPPDVLEQTAATVEVGRYPSGTSILRQAARPAATCT